MTIPVLAATCGVILLGLQTVLLARVWMALRQRWALWLGLGFALNATVCLRMLGGYHVEALDAVPQQGNAALVLAGLVSCTLALLDYVGAPRQCARRALALAAGVALLAFAGVSWGLVSRREGLLVWSAFLLAWMALFAWARRREPRRGHAVAMLAMGGYPLVVAAVLHGTLEPTLLTAAHVVFMVALGMALLTTGVLRAHAAASVESRRAHALLNEREAAERALLHAKETLEQRVAQRTAELRETIEGLESFNRSISHDLRGPLGGIAGVARLARDCIVKGNWTVAENMLRAISTQADASHALVGALLSLARASDASLQRECVDMQALAHEVVDALQHAGTPTRAEVVVGALPAVQADRQLMRQVLINLIGNALKFSAQVARARIEVGAVLEGGRPIFHVRDNGVGFAPEQAARLFKPFTRLHGSMFEGCGVGLSIVRRIVDRHGGAVWAEAHAPGGAVFRFSLQAASDTAGPVQPLALANAAPASPPPEPPAGSPPGSPLQPRPERLCCADTGH
jgi:signal transduction histidine kinase